MNLQITDVQFSIALKSCAKVRKMCGL